MVDASLPCIGRESRTQFFPVLKGSAAGTMCMWVKVAFTARRRKLTLSACLCDPCERGSGNE